MAADGSDSDSPDLEVLQLTREESRAVLDHQLALLNDLDDKATRTGRGAVLILGILISAGGIIGPEQIAAIPNRIVHLYAASGLFLFVTFVFGSVTYVSTNLTFGIGPDYIEEVRNEDYTHREWLSFLLDDYEDWITDMRQRNDRNAIFMSITEILFGVSMGILLAATILLVVRV